MAHRLSGWALVIDAVLFAAEKYRDQRRKDAHGSPAINHAIEAVYLLTHVAGVDDPLVLAAAVLHDVLKDTTTTADEIERRFGPRVRRLVEELSDPPGLPAADRRRRQLARTRTASSSARLIRLADKAANLGALPVHWKADARERYLHWMSRMSAALGGTNEPLEALLAERLRQELARPFTPAIPALQPAAESGETPASEIVQTFDKLQLYLGKSEELADLLAMSLRTSGLAIAPRRVRPPEAEQAPAPPKSRRPRYSEERWYKMAESGVGTVEITPKDARVSWVAIDGAPPFELSFTRATLLDILCHGTGLWADGFAPFQAYEAIAARMAAATHRGAGVHSVVVGISRLREDLWEIGGKSPQLVETSENVGARFRIRRPAG